MSESGNKNSSHLETSMVGLHALPSPELSRVIGNTIAGGDGALSKKISEAALQLFSYQTQTVSLPEENDYERYGAGDYFTLQRYRQSLAMKVQPNKIQLLGAEMKDSIGIDRSPLGISIRFTMKPSDLEHPVIVDSPMYRTEQERTNPELGMFLNVPERILPDAFSTEMALNSLRVFLLEKQRAYEAEQAAVKEALALNPNADIHQPTKLLFFKQVALHHYNKGKAPVLPFKEVKEAKSELKRAS